MDWDERVRFNASAPAPAGLQAMVRDVAPGAEITECRRLSGGLDAATHAIRLDPGGWVVLKRARPADAASLRGEFERLHVAVASMVATPEPVRLDADGAWFGHPALVMTLLEGASTFHPVEGPWIDNLAAAHAAVHQTPLPADMPEVLRVPHAGLHWEPAPPSELARTPRVTRLIETGLTLLDDPTDADDVLLHHDLHPGNVLWNGDDVAGVIDWNEARLGPAVCDIAYCAVDLVMTHGVAASSRFIAASPRKGGFEDLPRWLCLWTANAMRWIPYWIVGFADAGIPLELAQVRQRLDDYADFLLAGHAA